MTKARQSVHEPLKEETSSPKRSLPRSSIVYHEETKPPQPIARPRINIDLTQIPTFAPEPSPILSNPLQMRLPEPQKQARKLRKAENNHERNFKEDEGMYSRVEKPKENKSRAGAYADIQKKNVERQGLEMVDNSTITTNQKSLQLMFKIPNNVIQCVTQLPRTNRFVRDGLRGATRHALDEWVWNNNTCSVRFDYVISMYEHNPEQVELGDPSMTIRIDVAALRQNAAYHGPVGVPHAHIESVDRTQFGNVTMYRPRDCFELTEGDALDVIYNNVLSDNIKQWICDYLMNNLPGLGGVSIDWLDEV